MQPKEKADFVSVQICDKLVKLAHKMEEQNRDRCKPYSSDSFIFKVHKHLRSVNKKAYEPEIVAIGPYHHGKQNLKMMEEHKLRYLEQLLRRNGETSADKYIRELRSLESSARRCYAEPINFTTDKFVEMLLLDGCFVVEVIRKFRMPFLRNKNDPIFQMDWMTLSLQLDLILFENQLPFFILCKLFDLIKGQYNLGGFMHVALFSFPDILLGKDRSERVYANPDVNIKHLLGLIHNNWLSSNDGKKAIENAKNGKKVIENAQNKISWFFIPSATELLEAGIKIKKAEEGNLFDITFESGVIRIPPLTIEDKTETFLRNLMVYEQYSPDIQLSFITDYVRFIDCLINSSNDVKVLCHDGIIENCLGDEEVV